MSILDLTALELGKKIKAGEITSLQATEAVIKQIKAVEEQVHSYVTLDEEGAMKRAKEVQAQIKAGTLTGPLAGVPAAIGGKVHFGLYGCRAGRHAGVQEEQRPHEAD